MTVKIGPRRGKFRLGLNQRERRIADEYIAKGYTVLDSGWPDLLCISSDGKAEFVEVKSETDPLRPAQQKMHEGLKKAGIEVKVLRVSGQVLPTPPGEEDCPNTAEGTQTGRPPSPGSNTGMVVFRLSQEEAARLRRAAQERLISLAASSSRAASAVRSTAPAGGSSGSTPSSCLISPTR